MNYTCRKGSSGNEFKVLFAIKNVIDTFLALVLICKTSDTSLAF